MVRPAKLKKKMGIALMSGAVSFTLIETEIPWSCVSSSALSPRANVAEKKDSIIVPDVTQEITWPKIMEAIQQLQDERGVVDGQRFNEILDGKGIKGQERTITFVLFNFLVQREIKMQNKSAGEEVSVQEITEGLKRDKGRVGSNVEIWIHQEFKLDTVAFWYWVEKVEQGQIPAEIGDWFFSHFGRTSLAVVMEHNL